MKVAIILAVVLAAGGAVAFFVLRRKGPPAPAGPPNPYDAINPENIAAASQAAREVLGDLGDGITRTTEKIGQQFNRGVDFTKDLASGGPARRAAARARQRAKAAANRARRKAKAAIKKAKRKAKRKLKNLKNIRKWRF